MRTGGDEGGEVGLDVEGAPLIAALGFVDLDHRAVGGPAPVGTVRRTGVAPASRRRPLLWVRTE